MIDLYYWTTPNGHKITIFLEEVEFAVHDQASEHFKGEQFSAKFLAISPNGRIPAIVDHGRRGDPISVFESGAILQYLAHKTESCCLPICAATPRSCNGCSGR